MKTLLASILLSALAAGTALADGDTTAQPASTDCNSPCRVQPSVPAPAAVQPTVASVQPAAPADQSTLTDGTDEDTGWHRPAGQRFTSGFRMGWMHISHMNDLSRTDDNGKLQSLAGQYGIKSPDMFLIGYEGFYRIVGHSWLNVLMVGNVSVAGLDQSKFIPTASGLLGFEIQRSFELGVGVNLVPDTSDPSHMIIAAGWTPKIGSIQTPIHAFYIPEASSTVSGLDSNGQMTTVSYRGASRFGATIGMNW